jgi:hypothetical protein
VVLGVCYIRIYFIIDYVGREHTLVKYGRANWRLPCSILVAEARLSAALFMFYLLAAAFVCREQLLCVHRLMVQIFCEIYLRAKFRTKSKEQKIIKSTLFAINTL